MKSSLRAVVCFTLIIGVLVAPASILAQKSGQTKRVASAQSDEQRTRELLVKVDSGEVDGLMIKVLKRQGEAFAGVDPASVFKTGDSIKVAFRSNFNGYVYIINVTPGGKKKILFPYELEAGSEVNNMVSRGQQYELPRNGTWDFNEEVGVEVLQVYFSRDRVKVFDDAIKSSKGNLGTSAASAASELSAKSTDKAPQGERGGITTENVAPAYEGDEAAGIRTRKIRLAPGKSQEKVAIPEENGKPIKMASGDVAVFELRLKHI